MWVSSMQLGTPASRASSLEPPCSYRLDAISAGRQRAEARLRPRPGVS